MLVTKSLLGQQIVALAVGAKFLSGAHSAAVSDPRWQMGPSWDAGPSSLIRMQRGQSSNDKDCVSPDIPSDCIL